MSENSHGEDGGSKIAGPADIRFTAFSPSRMLCIETGPLRSIQRLSNFVMWYSFGIVNVDNMSCAFGIEMYSTASKAPIFFSEAYVR